eukprot:tig00001299_g8074.t1
MQAARRPPRRRLRALLIFLTVSIIVVYVFNKGGARKTGIKPRARTEAEEKSYAHTRSFWTNAEASVKGVTGGFESISPHDTKTTMDFIRGLMGLPEGEPREDLVAIDIAAGVGRVTKGALVHLFREVDLLEQNGKSLEEAKRALADAPAGRTFRFINEGMHEHVFEPERYHFALMNWAGGYISDEDFLDLLVRVRSGLKRGGYALVKDNVAETPFVDSKDGQRVRSDAQLKKLFAQAGFAVLSEKNQDGFPTTIVGVKMYGLRPLEDAQAPAPAPPAQAAPGPASS